MFPTPNRRIAESPNRRIAESLDSRRRAQLASFIVLSSNEFKPSASRILRRALPRRRVLLRVLLRLLFGAVHSFRETAGCEGRELTRFESQ
jgi:hypothetical protein